MRVGDLEILPVLDGVARFPISDPFLGMPEEAWRPHRQFLTSDDELELALGGFVLRDGDRVILIDTGVGRVDSGPFKGGAFLANLGALGVEPADVTDVIFTHLHFDHVGWATQQGTVVFPNATYRCDERDWGHFVGPDPGATRKLSPLADRMEMWDASAAGAARASTPWWRRGTRRAARSSWSRRAPSGPCCSATSCTARSSCSTRSGPAWATSIPNWPSGPATPWRASWRAATCRSAAAHFPGLQFGKLLVANGKRQWVID